jgi:hypothetical protein
MRDKALLRRLFQQAVFLCDMITLNHFLLMKLSPHWLRFALVVEEYL